jgi:hypothetical protein
MEQKYVLLKRRTENTTFSITYVFEQINFLTFVIQKYDLWKHDIRRHDPHPELKSPVIAFVYNSNWQLHFYRKNKYFHIPYVGIYGASFRGALATTTLGAKILWSEICSLVNYWTFKIILKLLFFFFFCFY